MNEIDCVISIMTEQSTTHVTQSAESSEGFAKLAAEPNDMVVGFTVWASICCLPILVLDPFARC